MNTNDEPDIPLVDNQRWEIFCQLMATGELKQAECARQAGYSPQSASQSSTKLMRKPEIRERIAYLRQKAARVTKLTVKEVIENSRKILEAAMADGKYKDANDANTKLLEILRPANASAAAVPSTLTEHPRLTEISKLAVKKLGSKVS